MSLWNHLPIEELIRRSVPPYGLGPRKWLEQYEQIRKLPETKVQRDDASD